MNEKVMTFIKQNKIHVAIWTIGLIVLGFYAYKQLTAPTYLLCGYMLNAENTNVSVYAKVLSQDFADAYNLELAKGDVTLYTNYVCEPDNDKKAKESLETVNHILIEQQGGNLDFVTAQTDVMTNLAYNTYIDTSYVFSNLKEVLTTEQIKFYEPYFLYIDLDVVDQLNLADEKNEDTSSIKLPDPTKPEKMKNPIPVFIDVSNVPRMVKIYGDKADSLAFGLVEGSPGQATALNFLEYIMFEEE